MIFAMLPGVFGWVKYQSVFLIHLNFPCFFGLVFVAVTFFLLSKNIRLSVVKYAYSVD